MRIEKIKLYEYNKLSIESKEKALRQHIARITQHGIGYQEEIFDSLMRLFAHTDNITLIDYQLGLSPPNYLQIRFTKSDTRNLFGKRAVAWLENNLLWKLRIPYTGKERWKLSKYGRYYRAGMIRPCPFTGICYDNTFLDSLKKEIREGCTLQVAFEGLAQTYKCLLEAEYQNVCSEESFEEHCEANKYEFEEDGTQWF